MRTISRPRTFKQDYKRVSAGSPGDSLDSLLNQAVAALVADLPLPARFRDHALAGRWKGYRDCHIRGDLVLIYRKPDDATLELVRLGSHSELGL
jgi:mRNA interferase YafQ